MPIDSEYKEKNMRENKNKNNGLNMVQRFKVVDMKSKGLTLMNK